MTFPKAGAMSLPFELDVLRTFVAIVENGGFTRASERVGRTQSTVSLQVKKLESRLGRRVFEREAGRELQLNARRRDPAAICAPDAGAGRRGALPPHGARHRWPRAARHAGGFRHDPPAEVLARFARAHPQVALEVNCDFTVNLLDAFSKGALRSRPCSNARHRVQAGAWASGKRFWSGPLHQGWCSTPASPCR